MATYNNILDAIEALLEAEYPSYDLDKVIGAGAEIYQAGKLNNQNKVMAIAYNAGNAQDYNADNTFNQTKDFIKIIIKDRGDILLTVNQVAETLNGFKYKDVTLGPRSLKVVNKIPIFARQDDDKDLKYMEINCEV